MAYPEVMAFDDKPLSDVLEIERLRLVERKEPFRQLDYIQGYAKLLDCSAIAVENEYIDRDYMEDHSVFYSRSFKKYEHSCRRVHFFKDVKASGLTDALGEVAAQAATDQQHYRAACREFSARHYIGFMVVKPLPGCPVGRTVLRTFVKDDPEKDYVREFGAARDYNTHLLGVELTVKGLAFQQQDEGVSACATTAIWSSLQKLRDFEDIAAATPAQITTVASRFALPFGRPMPSEGLSIDQMCQAIHALGISPNLVRVSDFQKARGIIRAATMSGMAPMLIIRNPNNELRHAVTVAGVKIRRTHTPTQVTAALDDYSGDLVGMYLHDDRIGPYLSAVLNELNTSSGPRPHIFYDRFPKQEPWELTHLLIPVHGKIRVSIVQLLRIASTFGVFAHATLRLLKLKPGPVGTTTRILRAHTYIEELLSQPRPASSERRDAFFRKMSLSRYVGVTELQVPKLGNFDVLVDTTGTPRNVHCLGIIYRAARSPVSDEFVTAFGQWFQCAAVG